MACSNEMANGSDLNNGLVVNDDVNVMELRGLFDEVLSFYLKEVCVYKNGSKAFPPKLGDGHEADLFRLFTAMRRVGSYESVSEDNMWEFVAKECGVEMGHVASLKLVYVKYLKELDQWLAKGGFKDLKMDNVDIGLVEKFEVLCHWLDVYECKKGECVGVEGTSGFNKNDGGMYLDEDLSPKGVKKVGYSMVNDEVKRSDVSPDNVVKKLGRSVIHDDDNDDNVKFTVKEAVVDNAVSHNVDNVEKVVSLQKRKWEEESLSFTEMLDWVANAARDPHDRAFDASQRSSKWKNYTGDKLWKQALLARRALFEELSVDSSNETNGLQKKNPKMHPSMYEDHRVQARCSRRTTATIPIPSRIKRQRTESVKTETKRISEIIEPKEQEYNLGPEFQAEVPPWTGVISDSDPKWLGTQMWPPPNYDNGKLKNSIMEIGIGRESSCECVFPGSVECVRFHIAENRFKVKIELGFALFVKWKFNQMGEEVSLSWELEEEKRFKSLVVKARHDLAHSNKSRREIMSNFWKKASRTIPDKTRDKIVSYYFNVFVPRRRSYQNRVTPKEIDSDNDEEEVGSVGDRFGYERIHGKTLKCAENLQCTNLES